MSLMLEAFRDVLVHAAERALHAAEHVDRAERTQASAELVAAARRFVDAVEVYTGCSSSTRESAR